MSAERHHESAEPNEALQDLESARAEKLAELRETNERDPQDAAERAERAREVINRNEDLPEPDDAGEQTAPPPAPRPHFNPRLNYEHTLASLQRSLSPVSRNFSKFIHTPAVEKTSEVLEKTVARPSVTAGATGTAFIIGAIFYLTARHFGYALSGSEMLFSFVIGAIIGLILEAVWRGLKPRV
jgi:hypothetical protein